MFDPTGGGIGEVVVSNWPPRVGQAKRRRQLIATPAPVGTPRLGPYNFSWVSENEMSFYMPAAQSAGYVQVSIECSDGILVMAY